MLYVDIMPHIFCFIFVVFLFKINSADVHDFFAYVNMRALVWLTLNKKWLI